MEKPMAVFKNEAEVHRYLGGIFDQAFTGDLGDKLAETGMVLRLNITDPDAVLTVDLPNREVIRGSTAEEPSATLTMSGDNANKFWQGKLNMMSAMATRKLKVEGNVMSMMKLQSSAEHLYEAYATQLRADGRTDLLIAD
jgi:putative sterol carrier protein